MTDKQSGRLGQDMGAEGGRQEPEFPMLSHGTADRRRRWPLISAVVAVLLVAVVVVGFTVGRSHGTRRQNRHAVVPAAQLPPSQVVMAAHGLVAQTPDIRSAVQAVMPPEMRSALGSPRMQQWQGSWTGHPPYGERNWSYHWLLNGGTNFHLDPTAATHSRGLYAIVSTYDTEQEAMQGFRSYEGGGKYIGSMFVLASCGVKSDKCHHGNALQGLGDSSFDEYLYGPLLGIDGPKFSGKLDQDGVVVGARFRNVAVYLFWYGVDISHANYSSGVIKKGTVLPYSSALPQGISYLKAIIARL